MSSTFSFPETVSAKRRQAIEATDRRSATFDLSDELRIADYKPFQALDGEGIRCSLYVSYCPFNCLGCYNKAAQKRTYGYAYTEQLEARILQDLSRPHVAGLTLVGGEPMLSAQHLIPLVKRIRQEVPHATVWSYTGYRFEVLNTLNDARAELLSLLDVLIDGPYIAELNQPVAFRGSANQRVLDVPASLRAGRAVECIK